MIRVHLPPDLAHALGAPATVAAPAAATVLDLIVALDTRHPGLRQRLTQADGSMRQHIAVYVGEDEGRRVEGSAAPLSDGDEVWLLRAVSGGQ